MQIRSYLELMKLRIGHGYDIHRIVPGRPLVLGGVKFEADFGLEGHSDADCVTHAICDAILGAAGLPDIGHFFPNTDPRWKGVPSKIFLEEAARQAMSAHMPPWLVNVILELNTWTRTNGGAQVTNTLPEVLGRPARTFAEFAKDHAHYWKA